MIRSDRGQATAELALLIALLVMPLVFGMIEMGFILSSHLTLSGATREGSRMGGNLANGGGTLGCLSGQSPNAATVDPQIIAAVERSLTGSGAVITLSNVTQIRIWKATTSGQETSGLVNVWTYSAGGGPVVDGDSLDFVQQSVGWSACSRTNVIPVDGIGVSVLYTHAAKSPLRYFLPGFATLSLSDRTVMPLNATQ